MTAANVTTETVLAISNNWGSFLNLHPMAEREEQEVRGTVATCVITNSNAPVTIVSTPACTFFRVTVDEQASTSYVTCAHTSPTANRGSLLSAGGARGSGASGSASVDWLPSSGQQSAAPTCSRTRPVKRQGYTCKAISLAAVDSLLGHSTTVRTEPSCAEGGSSHVVDK